MRTSIPGTDERRYQVFISSTFLDLQEERHAVMQALLTLGCMPAGMELFPAADEEQWSLIKEVIDECDYYVLIVGGRYGSRGADGQSYTEKEYRYALEQGKPIIAFLHKDPSALTVKDSEPNDDGRVALATFRALAEKKMCSYWSSGTELSLLVTQGMLRLFKKHPAVGWVRSDRQSNATAAESLRLRRRIEELESSLSSARQQAPAGAAGLAQGTDTVHIRYLADGAEAGRDDSVGRFESSVSLTWDTIFECVAPLMIDEASEDTLKSALSSLIDRNADHTTTFGEEEEVELRLQDFVIADDAFQLIKIQLRALGLITQSTRQRRLADRRTFWSLTPYGDDAMMTALAIARDADA